MGYVVNEKEPQLVGIFGTDELDEVENIKRMVDKLNQDLIDSGFEQYQYHLKRDGDKTYIEQKGA
jgi:hypothetical protein